jgi:hypothetical protein
VSTVAELRDAVQLANPGDTILVADGTYSLGGDDLWIDVPGVTLRSSSGDREAVVLDGGYLSTEILTIAASNVTVADLRIERAQTHPIHVVSTDQGSTTGMLVYNVHIVDPGQQAIKINPHAARTHYPDGGVVACSHIELTDAGRLQVWEINGSCYTGGIDGHQARGWVVRDNLIEGFWCEEDLAEHGIHFWSGSRDTLVERNVVQDCARGIGLGLGESGDWRSYPDDPCAGADYGHYAGIARNNVVFAGQSALFASEYSFDCGICLEQVCGTQVLHNTVASTSAPASSSIEWRWSSTTVTVSNNLASHDLVQRDGAAASVVANLEDAPLSLFVDGAGGNLHLAAHASAAIDQGASLPPGLCDEDIDGDVRPVGPAPDIGADERLHGPHAISGQVYDEGGRPVPHTTLSAGSAGSATTDASGAYTIASLTAGTYVVVPSRSGWAFSPSERTVSVPPSATGQDFVGSTQRVFLPLILGSR